MYALNSIDSYFLEFKQAIVPFNMLSGFQDDPNNPGIFPRPLGLKKRNNGSLDMWNIRIRGRWCLQSRGCVQFYSSDWFLGFKAALP